MTIINSENNFVNLADRNCIENVDNTMKKDNKNHSQNEAWVQVEDEREEDDGVIFVDCEK